MLSVANVRTAGGAANYFAADNYYTRADADRSGEWLGKGAQKLGKMTASFGVAELRDGDEPELLLQRADAKLYEAKYDGRNRVAAYGRTSK